MLLQRREQTEGCRRFAVVLACSRYEHARRGVVHKRPSAGSLYWLSPYNSLYAVACTPMIAATPMMSCAFEPRDKSAAGRSRPNKIWPYAFARETCWINLLPILPEFRSGKTNTFA